MAETTASPGSSWDLGGRVFIHERSGVGVRVEGGHCVFSTLLAHIGLVPQRNFHVLTICRITRGSPLDELVIFFHQVNVYYEPLRRGDKWGLCHTGWGRGCL